MPRAALALAVSVVLGGCTIPLGKVEREPAADSAPGDPAVLRDLGLSCDRCMFSWGSGCSILNEHGTVLVAVAQGAKVADELQECFQPQAPGGSQRCVVHRAYRFDDLKFLRRPTDIKPTDAFSGADRTDSRNPNRHDGLRLQLDKRYVIVAARPDGASTQRADWNLAAACEVPANATFPIHHD